jgi:hypothetical protein
VRSPKRSASSGTSASPRDAVRQPSSRRRPRRALLLSPARPPAPRASPDGFATDTIPAREFAVRLAYPAEFQKSRKYGRLVLVGPPQDDRVAPSLLHPLYVVPENRPSTPLVRLLEDRYRKIEATRSSRRTENDLLLYHRIYHYPGSELAVDELVGFKRTGEHLLEVRCVSALTAPSSARPSGA